MPKYSYYGEELQDHDSAPRLVPTATALQNYTYCPTAKALLGVDPNTEQLTLVGLPCKRWGCVYCATRKIRRLAWMTKNAEPNRLLTLTINSQTDLSPKEVWDLTAPQVPELIRLIRKNRGECEYMRVLELHKTGYPHYHMLLRSSFVPHAHLLAWWRGLIGPLGINERGPDAPKSPAGVNVKAIDKSFGTFRYLVKYLTKLHRIEWTDRHVSYSRSFFREEDREEREYAQMDVLERIDEHPWMYLARRFDNAEVRVTGEGQWVLPEQFCGTPRDMSPDELRLPCERTPEAPWRGAAVQTLLMPDVNAKDYF